MKTIINRFATDAFFRIFFASLFSLIGFCINAVTFYPGICSPDSFDQYGQALSNHYGDWHPPAMAGLWHLLLNFYQGPQPMLFFQLGLFWIGFYLIFVTFLKHFTIFAPLVLVFAAAPFIQNFPGIIWKDVHMSFSWFLAASILFRAFVDGRKLFIAESLFCLLLISYGCWVRISGMPGIIPLLFLWWTMTVRNEKLRSFVVTSVVSLILTFMVLMANSFIEKNILKVRKDHIEYKLIAHDLTGISVKSKELCFPDYISSSPGFDTSYLFSKYTCVTFDHIWWNNDNKHIMPDLNPQQLSDLKQYWVKTILKHPFIYLKNKTNGFLFFLKFKDSGNGLTVFYTETYKNNYGISFTPNKLSKIVFGYVKTQEKMFYMKPWFWFLLNILIIVVLALSKAFTRYKLLLSSLAWSSFFYLMIHWLVYPADTEFRYFYWNCISISLCAITMVAVKYRKNETEGLHS
ncbi:hypothetical protein CNR22_09495 [Sphingobacteriaceae bacterium]|nr:hypothetical protein CNR22_09495 [Sphingobacteriaceae bacterium]